MVLHMWHFGWILSYVMWLLVTLENISEMKRYKTSSAGSLARTLLTLILFVSLNISVVPPAEYSKVQL